MLQESPCWSTLTLHPNNSLVPFHTTSLFCTLWGVVFSKYKSNHVPFLPPRSANHLFKNLPWRSVALRRKRKLHMAYNVLHGLDPTYFYSLMGHDTLPALYPSATLAFLKGPLSCFICLHSLYTCCYVAYSILGKYLKWGPVITKTDTILALVEFRILQVSLS